MRALARALFGRGPSTSELQESLNTGATDTDASIVAPVPDGGTPSVPERVTILHLSDTHNLHRMIEEQFPLPSADMLIHTGDWSDQGTIREAEDFNAWLGEIKARFKHILVIAGNHEWRGLRFVGEEDALVAATADANKGYLAGLLTNATVLDHEGVSVLGINIYGSPWVPATSAANPDQPDGRSLGLKAVIDQGTGGRAQFDAIPAGTDVLLTHGPPAGVFDQMEGTSARWGSSEQLARRVATAAPTAHLFGHLHEQRGVWYRGSREEAWRGGVEYERVPGEPFTTWPAPPVDHPCTLISCNAMKNHPTLEGGEQVARIAGGGRLIVATPQKTAEGAIVRKPAGVSWPGAANAVWRFDVVSRRQEALTVSY